MREQNCRAANLAESPGLLHGKMARAKTIFASHRKTVAVQGCSPCSPRAGSSRGRSKTTAMMFALLQEQHKAQLEAMMAANIQAMDAMLQRMNALIADQGKAVDKVTATIPNSNTGQASNTTNRKKKVCTNCRKLVFHKPQTCKQMLPRMEIKQSRQCDGLTGTGDVK